MPFQSGEVYGFFVAAGMKSCETNTNRIVISVQKKMADQNDISILMIFVKKNNHIGFIKLLFFNYGL